MGKLKKLITILFLFSGITGFSLSANAEDDVDISLSFSKTFTVESKVSTEARAAAEPKLVEPSMQSQPTATEPSSAPAEEVSEPAASQTPTPAPQEQRIPPTTNAITMLGVVIPYQNGGMAQGQAVIDANPNGMASTWGGASPFSGTDGMNTHFIGHHWGVFDPVINLSMGGVVTVYDSVGNAFNYTIYKIKVVDVAGNDVDTGKSLYGEITSTGGGERIVLQTCIDTTTRRIIFAA
ncbi:MAG: hypothetical protein LBS33_03120 [Streptococcaceae bacterium]|nr:hypothetical protein [Streptococcaceae bacterium]